MQVEAAIDEADVGRLRVGLPVSFSVDAFPRRSFAGEIKQIRKSPQTVQNVVSYTVVISAQNNELALLPGMTANVRIVVESRESALKVPNAALRWRPAGAPQPLPADVPAQQAGGQAVQQFRMRLVEELKPSETQKAKLEEIFAESRQKMAGVRDLQKDADRRRQVERIRGETNARIAEILTPGQRPAWERLLAEAGGRGQASSGRVHVLENGAPKALDVRLGLTDGSSTELLGGGLAEGTEVIIGVAEGGRAGASSASGGFPKGRFF
jgi:HlyD family secretion protein